MRDNNPTPPAPALCLCGLVLILALAVTGCVSASKAERQAQRAAYAALQQAQAEELAKQPAVWFRGDVRNERVGWEEGLTLSQALLTAQYTWSWDPRLIAVTRNGETFPINVRRLLRGQEDPLLEPGDLIEVRH